MAHELTRRLIDAAVTAIRDHADELTGLDQAIGDGDHGINMKRGFDAIADAPELKTLPLGDALQKAGMTLVMKVGGASGPLFGSLLMAMGKAVPGDPTQGEQVQAMLAEGIAAVKKRGKSDAGEKTMLDVLVPVGETLAGELSRHASAKETLAGLCRAADAALERTRPMKASKGRASFLGDRSIGHLDPGARSSQLLIHAVCDAVAESLPA
ncbi:dihydroxyacetone kinase subunit L [Hypericibacter adhaerens]|jgi:dihydroxyacetone kinase-like protein|uniref:Dihydroxyacetone kinase subunit L n=1 Tax=Hypericibacter adhaerens TaxID=2602016 RepID=A0A5J6MZR1_9PROT|nr:dihydroxyacetone kinase subunit DhaL [Hypericibacter adhaerens]QEX23059.1 dihydroxyacetone kinase subunit L [Hypericibacter adhaerens]